MHHRSEILWVEDPRRKLFARAKRAAVRIFLLVFVGAGAWGGLTFASWLGYQSAMRESIPSATPSPLTPTPTLESAHRPFAVTGEIGEEREPYQEPESRVIEGLLTYGDEDPLTRLELADLIDFLNSDPLPMEEDAYYISFLASETAYRSFSEDQGESLQGYLVRHVVWMDREIRNAIPPVEGGLSARRMIVIEDGVWESDWDARGPDYVAQGLTDSDGSWSFVDPYCPKTCAFWHEDLRLDFGLMHEWIHSIFKLPDHYALDYHAQFDVYGVLAGLPELWRFYMAGGRPDLSLYDFASGGSGFTMRRYSALQLQRRQDRGASHDKWRSLEDLYFPREVPEMTVLDFGPAWGGAEIRVFQTRNCPPIFPDRKASSCKTLGPSPILEGRLDQSGRFPLGNPFAGDGTTVLDKDGVLFIQVTVGDKLGFRWMDIRDFNLAYWSGFTESVRMRMILADGRFDPEEFLWSIDYQEVNQEPSAASE